MAKARTIQLADPRADRPRTEWLTTIAIGASSLGLVLALGLAKALPEHRHADASETTVSALSAIEVTASARTVPASPPLSAAPKLQSVAKTAPPAPAPATKSPAAVAPAPRPIPLVAAAKPPTAAPSSAPREATPVAVVSPRGKPREDDPPAKRKLPKRSFEMGVVAYTRCDGLERPGSRYPCPRDRKLEDEVWQTLERLSQCTAADPGRGAAEVRLTLRKAAAPGVDLKPAASGPSLNLRAVSKCAGPKLAQARTRLRSPHAVVSFRFGLK